jgi:hypothetical protein
MTSLPGRPFPFTSSHEWVEECESSCPFNHSRGRRHCRKCGITRDMAQARSLDLDGIDVEACPVRDINKCRRCQVLSPIPVECLPSYSLCPSCLHPNTPTYHTVKEALAAMLDINAGKPPEPTGRPIGLRNKGDA